MSEDVTFDFSNYRDRVGGRVPPNRYRVTVDDTEVDKSNAGNVMINVWLRITGGEYDGTVVIDRLTQTEKALFRTVNFMQALGFPTPKKRLKVNIRSWIGRQLDVDLEDGEPYLGKVKSEVRGYNRIEGGKRPVVADLEGLEEFTGDVPDAVRNPTTPADMGPMTSAPQTSDPWEMPSTESVSVGDAPDEVDLDTLNLG
jgi:hypothetical protein